MHSHVDSTDANQRTPAGNENQPIHKRVLKERENETKLDRYKQTNKNITLL